MRVFGTMDEYARACAAKGTCAADGERLVERDSNAAHAAKSGGADAAGGSASLFCGPSVVALGMFDGVHAGHAALISEAVRRARALGACAVVHTFAASPLRALRPEIAPPNIQTLADKLAQIARLGVDAAVCEEFTPEYARRSGAEFARALKDKLRARAVVVGYNYTFGDKGACGARELESFGAAMGFEVEIMPKVSILGGAVSSTRIREELARGDVAAAGALLGRDYELAGIVASGKHIGRTLGFATANLNIDARLALPKAGVYACALKFDGDWLPGVLNIGVHPTLPEGGATCEAHALTEIGDVYGKFMRVAFLKFMRPEQKFGGVDELRAQVKRDKAAAREFFASGDALVRLNAQNMP